jgi:lysozyme
MKISLEGLDLIKKYEGFSPKKYLCPAGKSTIGYGHVIRPNENYIFITKQQAESLLRQDVEIAENTINDSVKVPLTQSQFDSLVSLVYNWGGHNFLRSEGLEKINKKDYNGAIEEFSEVNEIHGKISKGLVNRRMAEANLFNKGEHV